VNASLPVTSIILQFLVSAQCLLIWAVSHLMWKMERRSFRLHDRAQSLDDLVSAQQQRLRDRQAERLRRLQIDDQLERRRLLNR